MDVFELIELGDGRAMIVDGDAPDFTKGRGIQIAQTGGTIAEDQISAVLREAPAFALVVEGSQQAEGEAVIDKRCVRLPCELNECAVPVCEPSAKYSAGASCCWSTRPVFRSSMRSEE